MGRAPRVRAILVWGALLFGCGSGGGYRGTASDLAGLGDGGCPYLSGQTTCGASNPGSSIGCDRNRCCQCVQNNVILKTCVAPSNIVDPCGANNCCGATP
jgi:hypothetical protein